MSTFVAEIKHSLHNIDYTPASAASAGAVVVLDEMIGVLPSDLAASEKGALMILGEAEFAKPTGTGTDWVVGTQVFWDATDGNVQADSDSGTNKHAGRVIAMPATTDTTVRVFIFPSDQDSA